MLCESYLARACHCNNQKKKKIKAPKREGGTWINNLSPCDSAPIFRGLLFLWDFEKGLRIVYTWSDVSLMQHRVFSVSLDLTPMKSEQPIWGICITQFLLDLLGIVVDKYPREKFFASYQAKCLILNFKWIKIIWRRCWENLAMSQWLEPPKKKESFKLGLNSSWNPTLERPELNSMLWATPGLQRSTLGYFSLFYSRVLWMYLNFFFGGVKPGSSFHLPNLSNDFCCPKTVYFKIHLFSSEDVIQL